LDWAHAPFYMRRRLAAHAAAAGLLDGLLEDPGFLVAADPSGLLPVLDSASSPRPIRLPGSTASPQTACARTTSAERAVRLQLAAGKVGLWQVANVFGPAAGPWPWTTRPALASTRPLHRARKYVP
jgi:hypothetical protein